MPYDFVPAKAFDMAKADDDFRYFYALYNNIPLWKTKTKRG